MYRFPSNHIYVKVITLIQMLTFTDKQIAFKIDFIMYEQDVFFKYILKILHLAIHYFLTHILLKCNFLMNIYRRLFLVLYLL